MSSSNSTVSDPARATKLAKFLNSILYGDLHLKTLQNGNLFIEALCAQSDPPACIERVISSPRGLASLQACTRFNAAPSFQNGPATNLIQYMQCPALKTILGGEYLRQIILHIVEPPIFWNAFLLSFRNGSLNANAQQCFGWLLHELICLPTQQATNYLPLAQDTSIQNLLLDSVSFEVRTIGQRITHVLSTFNSPDDKNKEYGPGGRHDNDFVDFREVAILPTADEILSEEEPFLRLAETIDDPENTEKRLVTHLDNQFRLLRDDMLVEMRDELQIIFGKKKGKHRGLIVDGFTVLDVVCGDVRKRHPWRMRLQATTDLRNLFHCQPKDREAYLKKNRNVFKHQSLTCLVLDGEIVAFPTIVRIPEELAKKLPIVTIEFAGKTSTVKALLRLKMARSVKLVQIDTAVFAFEHVLRGLQELKDMPLVDELLFWGPGSSTSQPPDAPTILIDQVENDPAGDLQGLLSTTNAIHLDESQAASLLTGLKQKVSLIQGPPGTGKSFIGALIAKSIYKFTKKVIHVVCFTNHALDQFLEDLLDIGIPAHDMLRLGGKSTPRTKCMALYGQPSTFQQTSTSWKIIEKLRLEINDTVNDLQTAFSRYNYTRINSAQLLEYLEFHPEYADFHEAFTVPKADDGSIRVGRRGRGIDDFYLIARWLNGGNPGIFSSGVRDSSKPVWQLSSAARQDAIEKWNLGILKERVTDFYTIAEKYSDLQVQLERMFKQKDADVISSRRIVACTTTAAAKYSQELQAASRDVVLVEEAGEILESHVLTALGRQTQQLILIGDHKQLRPKVNNYKLTVEKGEGYDLNRSLFERLIRKGFPHRTLHQQHRMRPEISALIRSLTYPDLVDAPKTQSRPDIRGLQSNVVFISHEHREDEAKETANWKDMSSVSSKQNRFEVDMVLKCVRYLAQQGYGTEKIVILTPYLGQLHLLQKVLSQENDPVLNDLDSFDLVRAGLLPAASAKLNQRQINLSTIVGIRLAYLFASQSLDNYQGEESMIVIVSLTRSNEAGDIGFMAAPERLNVLLSRARDSLIMIGNPKTFLEARKGKELWKDLFGLLKQCGSIYDGLPVKCERHPKRAAILRETVDFEIECPDGGCKEPCGTTLSCGVHLCPQKCHQLFDHSKVQCEHILRDQCPKGHNKSWKCHKPPPKACTRCDEDAKRDQDEKQKALEMQEKRARKDTEHRAYMAKLDAMLDNERQRMKDAQTSHEREVAIRQKEQDIEKARALADEQFQQSSQPLLQIADSSVADRDVKPSRSTSNRPSSDKAVRAPECAGPKLRKGRTRVESPAKEEWEDQKKVENATNGAIDAVMDMVGLEEVKLQILKIKAKIDASVRQNSDIKEDRLNVAFLGNPGTGKTTVARLYAKILTSLGALPGEAFVETTGSRLANDGVAGIKKHIEGIHNAGGGALFIDEAYQLADQHNFGGRQVLDFLLAEMENNVGKIVFILAGYNKEMEKFFEHNPGLPSRVPYTLQFTDYQDDELLWMLQQRIEKRYQSRMAIEEGKDGLYMRIVVRRLGRGRGRPGFGNARALQTTYSKIAERQADRLKHERKDGLCPDDFLLTKEDLIGPDPSQAILNSVAWEKLQELTGLTTVKESIKGMIDRISVNYQRELEEKSPITTSLNRVFLGNPGTGKTSVAKLYGQILADLALLSNGEVVIKNPADFIGSVLGQSESNTKNILSTTVGKVLIIDEAYMLYSGNGGVGNQSDMYKTAVIDTIVAEVQSTPGEDRCVLLLGYEEEIRTMFQNVNPGLSRRFAIESAFRFEDFNDDELLEILELKMKHQDLDATPKAKSVAIEVLSRGRNRPNFGNAGEVENLLGLAKGRYQARQSSKLASQQNFDVIFEPQDFDPDYQRGEHAATNLQKLFEDIVGCEEVVDKLAGYQQIAQNMKARNRQSRGMIPTNFLFKGPPGTGKTTTARKMGQVFFDMGFLSAVEVVECSASDLIGSYVGQTGPKTRAQLEKALGKVLFVDEAYRLAEGNFATEAINELVDLLTKPTFMDKIVVILAGYDNDINKLLSVNPGLASRFPEQVVFRDMSPEHCLEVLKRSIEEQDIQSPPITDPESDIHTEMVVLFKRLASLPSWGNARDIKTLAKTMIGSVFRSQSSPSGALAITADEILRHTKVMLQERQDRSTNLPSTSTGGNPPDLLQRLPPSQPLAPPAINTAQANKAAEPPPNPLEAPPSPPPPDAPVQRDDGVSDETWAQLQADARAAHQVPTSSPDALRNGKSTLTAALAAQKAKLAALKRLEDQTAAAAAAAEANAATNSLMARVEAARVQRLKQSRETARMEERAARAAAERAKEELERLRVAEVRRKREEAVQVRLREMGVCCMGFRWVRQSGGYRCQAGGHFVSNGQLGLG